MAAILASSPDRKVNGKVRAKFHKVPAMTAQTDFPEHTEQPT